MVNFFTHDKNQVAEENRLDDEVTARPTKKNRASAEAELKAGRWVAPIILIATMIISGGLWLLKNFQQK